ncbi:IS1634 family transposase [Pontiella sp.]|uniref:IS1634 family transposase n=1 Tax=Pontiella sp. TaxID=2837462 RepID=UPI003568247E
MFFREKKSRKTRVLQLVENHRNAEGKVCQRVVVSLGGCPVPDEHRKRVAAELSRRMAGYEQLLSEEPVIEYWVGRVLERMEEAGHLSSAFRREIPALPACSVAPIHIDGIEHENGVRLGPSLVLLRAWESLGLDPVLKEQGFSDEQLATAKAVVFNRLIEPSSENELPNWIATTALGDLFGLHTEGWAEDRFYRIGDKLLKGMPELEAHLRRKERDLFNLDRTILLYDLTNSYFEGSGALNPLARRSVASKEKRSDCPLISVGIVLDAEGFIIRHKVFAGNISDCKTLLDAVADLEHIAEGEAKPVVIVDGGMASQANLDALRERGYDYIVNGKRRSRADFADDFLDIDSFRRVEGRGKAGEKQPVFVRRISTGAETVVLCRSAGRKQKEDAIVDNAERKLIEGLEVLQARIIRNDKRLKLDESPALVNRAIGRLLSRTTRASRLYTINYDPETQHLDWHRKETEWDTSRDLHGCYHLRSTLELKDQQLWQLYITLVRVEDAFRSMKSDLGLHPFHHQLADRCRAHIWITVLAYHLLRWIEHSLKLSGYDCTWRTLRRRLDTHGYTSLIVPDADGLEHHLRKPGRPNPVQKLIYALLGIDWTALPIRRHTYKTEGCAKM